MRRNLISRGFAGVFSLWLGLCMVEPVQVHTCAMHGGLAIDASPAGAHQTVAHHMVTHASNHSNGDQDSDTQSRQCSCLGDCNAGSTSIGLPAASISLESTARTDGSKAVFTYASAVISASDHLLPFANGPPRISSRA